MESSRATRLDPRAQANASMRSRRGRRATWIAWVAGLAVLTVLVVGGVLAARYQPVAYGEGEEAIQGQVVIKAVDRLGITRGQTYIPPQAPTTGSLIVSLTNTGPFAVTVLSVAPVNQGSLAVLTPTGAVTYVPLAGSKPEVTGKSPRIDGVSLRTGEQVLVRIPFRTPECWQTGTSLIREFSVTTKFLFWTHRIAISWTSPANSNNGAVRSVIPAAPSARNAQCLRRGDS
jgi:hypothetical protein